ncbi:MAG: type II secretion system F family protein [Planctomycetaceae bacterium]
MTARNAVRVGLGDDPDESITAQAKASNDSSELRLTAWCLVLVPILQLGFVGPFYLFPLIWGGVAIWTGRRSRESHFLWTLALAVENDLPLDEEVEAFAIPLWRKKRKKYFDLAGRLRDGRSLIDALELGGVLPANIVAELRAAQAAGVLPQALRAIAARQTSSLLSNRFNGSIAMTAVYVWSVLTIVFLVVGFIMYWIVPKFKEIFNDFGVELPAWTVQAVTLSDWFVSYFYLSMPLLSLPIFASIAATIVGVSGWGNLNYPLLMRWFPRWDAPGLLRGLAYAVHASRPLTDTLEEMAEHQQRRDMTERLLRMRQMIELGQPLSSALAQEGYVRPIEANALAAAEEAGNLPWALRTLAESMERTGWHRTQFWLEFLKPAAVLTVGCVVAFFVIAFFLPLVKLINELT